MTDEDYRDPFMSDAEHETAKRQRAAMLEVRAADTALEEAVRRRIAAGNADAVEALRQLAGWVPEFGYPANWPLAYGANYDAETEAAERERLNDNCPFATEAYTYELFGKDQGRTYLALLGSLARALGFEGLHDLNR